MHLERLRTLFGDGRLPNFDWWVGWKCTIVLSGLTIAFLKGRDRSCLRDNKNAGSDLQW